MDPRANAEKTYIRADFWPRIISGLLHLTKNLQKCWEKYSFEVRMAFLNMTQNPESRKKNKLGCLKCYKLGRKSTLQ